MGRERKRARVAETTVEEHDASDSDDASGRPPSQRNDDALAQLREEFSLAGYARSLAGVRGKRSVHLFVGPPNSGKSYTAFDELAGARSGVYLAPLRLLALEGRDALACRGVMVDLLTGEDRESQAGSTHVSCTIEMLPKVRRRFAVAVIDEGQMLFDASRGWAWTAALLGAAADRLIIVAGAHAVSAIAKILDACGEVPVTRHFERKRAVKVLEEPLSTTQLRKGDAVVAFSRADVLKLRDELQARRPPLTTAVVYGALPSEARRREAERFSSGVAEVLVATDAVGQGLNLPIQRLFFSKITKFDGKGFRTLNVAETHQIAGRAGRFGFGTDAGVVGVLAHSAEEDALLVLRSQLACAPAAPLTSFRAPVAPSPWHVRRIMEALRLTDSEPLENVLRVFYERLGLDRGGVQTADGEKLLKLASRLDEAAPGMSVEERFAYATAPLTMSDKNAIYTFMSWAGDAAMGSAVDGGKPNFLRYAGRNTVLDSMESVLRECTLWLYMTQKFPATYGHHDEVLALRDSYAAAISVRFAAPGKLDAEGTGRVAK